MPIKTTIKKDNTIAGIKFDTDLSGLYKPEQSIEILGKKIRFRSPSIVQKALMIRFLVLAIQDIVSTEVERSSMSFEDLYTRCVTKLKEIDKEKATQKELDEYFATLGRMFSNPDANEYLIRALAQSFPDLSDPETLTEEAFMQAAAALIQAMNIG